MVVVEFFIRAVKGYLDFVQDIYLDYCKGTGWLIILIGFGLSFGMIGAIFNMIASYDVSKKAYRKNKRIVTVLLITNIIVVLTLGHVLRDFRNHLDRRFAEGRPPIWYNKK